MPESTAEPAPAQLVCFIIDQTRQSCGPLSKVIKVFLASVLKELLTILSCFIFSASHMLTMRKLIYYDAKLPRLIPLLMLAAFPYEAQVVTDLTATQGEPGAACTLRPTSSFSTMRMCKPRETRCCSAPVRVEGRRKHSKLRELQFSMRLKMNAAHTIVDCNHKMAVM